MTPSNASSSTSSVTATVTPSTTSSRRRFRPSGRAVGVALGLVALGGIATGAVAAIPHSSTGVISGCYLNGSTKTLRVIDAQAGDTCPAGTTPISWNSAGIKFRGAYGATTAYKVNDVVTQGGSSYIALINNTGVPVTNTTNWATLAKKGGTGDQGVQGPQGAQGPQGPQGVQGPAGPTNAGKFVDMPFFSSSTVSAWQPVGSTTYTVPGGANVVARFAAESYCSDTAWCSVRILVDGVEMQGGSGTGAAFDDADTSSTYEAHSIDRYAAGLTPGTHTVSVEAYLVSSGGTAPFFRLDDDTLVVTTIG